MKRIEKEDLITAIKNAVKEEYSRRQEFMYRIQVLIIRKLHMNLKLQGIKEYNLVDYTDDLKPKLPTPNKLELTTQIELWKREDA